MPYPSPIGRVVLGALLLSYDVTAGAAEEVPPLFGVTFWSRQLILINPETGAGTLITDVPVSSQDLAVREGRLYILSGTGESGTVLRAFDPSTGAWQVTQNYSDPVPGGEGAFDFRADGIGFASRSVDAIGTLYQIDFAKTNLTLLTAVGGLTPSLDGLAFDSEGVLYGLQQNQAGAHALYTVNPTNGQTTLVGPLNIHFPFNGAVAGLAFSPTGELFAALGNQEKAELYLLKKSTGAASLIGSIGFPGVSGIRFLPVQPGPLRIHRAGPNARLAWAHLTGGRLQDADELAGGWKDHPAPVTTNGFDAVVLIEPAAEKKFFRLAR